MTTKYAVNCSILFTELPLAARPRAAKDAGYDAVEFWWPFDSATPERSDIESFIEAIRTAEVSLIALNTYAGNMGAGERGVLSHQDRHQELQASMPALRQIAAATGVRRFNALYGRPLPGIDPQQQANAAVAGLRIITEALADLDALVLLEAVSGIEDFGLRTFGDCLALQEAAAQAGVGNVGLIADFYHLAANGEDVGQIVSQHAANIDHVQVADLPGRGEPGSGDLPLGAWLDAITAKGYQQWVGLEFSPATSSLTSLNQMNFK